MTPSGPRWALSVNDLLYISMPFPLLISARWGITAVGLSDYARMTPVATSSCQPVVAIA